ncbi:MAG: DUF4126 domain-containing protein [Candidatus Sumerlaeaceae bacterium]
MTPYESIISQLALALGASWCAGINLYATVAVLGLMSQYVPGFQLPQGLEVLGSPWVIVPALFMYCIEFVADKIPAVDSAWDTIHTFIRVPAGAALAAAAFGNVPPEVQVGAALIGGTLALGSHTAKATTRLAAHTTGTSPLVSPAVSLVEDGLVIGTIGLLAAHPLLSLSFTVAMIIAAGVLLYVFAGIFRKLWNKFAGHRSDAGSSPPPSAPGAALHY